MATPITKQQAQRYMNGHWNECPKCHRDDIEANAPQSSDGGGFTVHIVCLDCSFEWEDVFNGKPDGMNIPSGDRTLTENDLDDEPEPLRDGTRIIARFHPQAWINNEATEVDPEGPVEFDVTGAILAMPRNEALAMLNDRDESDDLARLDTAPQWIKDWSGPFWVEVRTAIYDYFERGT